MRTLAAPPAMLNPTGITTVPPFTWFLYIPHTSVPFTVLKLQDAGVAIMETISFAPKVAEDCKVTWNAPPAWLAVGVLYKPPVGLLYNPAHVDGNR